MITLGNTTGLRKPEIYHKSENSILTPVQATEFLGLTVTLHKYFQCYEVQITLTQECLEWWVKNMPKWNGKILLKRDRFDYKLRCIPGRMGCMLFSAEDREFVVSARIQNAHYLP